MKRDSVLISKIMAAVHSKNTLPEIRLRKALRTLGRRLRSHPLNIPGHPDLVFTKERVAVFVDGDFWHGRQWRLRKLPSLEHQFSESKNRSYWIQKISRNVERDKRTTRELRRLGWTVIRVWESDLNKNMDKCVLRIQRTMKELDDEKARGRVFCGNWARSHGAGACWLGGFLSNDIAPEKLAIYRDNFSSEEFLLGDIVKLEADRIPEISLATASFPCIDLSLAGNRSGLNGTHSSAYWHFYRVLKEMGARRPMCILLENVVGLLSSNGGHDLRSILVSLNKLGYANDILMVDAVHFVPQSRERLFVIASLLPSRVPRISSLPIHQARPHQITEFIHKHSDLQWSHLILPPLPTRKYDLEDLIERFSLSSSVWWDCRRQNHLFTQMSVLHKERLQELTQSRKAVFATVYKRVRSSGCRAEIRTDGVAGCLRTPRGGSSKQFVIQAGKGQWRVRNMTAREYARLQGVPDTFNITVPYIQALWGFGDAVCVPARGMGY